MKCDSLPGLAQPLWRQPPGVPYRPPSLHLQLFSLLPGTTAAKVWGGEEGGGRRQGGLFGKKTIRNLSDKRLEALDRRWR